MPGAIQSICVVRGREPRVTTVGGDGADIRVNRSGDGWRLDYSIGYGDCP
jgi:hypothetical protein